MTDMIIYEDPKNPWAERPLPMNTTAVCLTDPEYYLPNSDNPHTDNEGFLPHDGGQMPDWVRNKPVECRLFSKNILKMRRAQMFYWPRQNHPGDVLAYRIVVDMPKEPESIDTAVGGGDKIIYGEAHRRAVATVLHQIDESLPPGPPEPPLFSPGFTGPAWEKTREKYLAMADKVLRALADVHEAPETVGLKFSPPQTVGPKFPHSGEPEQLTEDMVHEAIDSRRQRTAVPPTGTETRHRNELAARLGVPVPGMAEWLEGPLREARRVRYAAEALRNISQNPGGWSENGVAINAHEVADAMAREGE